MTGLGHGAPAEGTATRRPKPVLRVAIAAGETPGDERWLLEAGMAFVEAGHEVLVAAPRGSLLERAGAISLPVRELPPRRILDPRAWMAVRAMLSRHRSHAVFAADTASLDLVLAANLVGHAPLVFAAPEAGGRGHRIARRRLARALVPGIAAESTGQTARRTALLEGVGLPEAAPPDRAALRRELRLPRRVSLVVQVAPLVDGAGHEMALRAVAHLAAEPTAAPPGAPAPGLLLCCVGTGPAESRLRVLTHELGIKEHVIWAGARRDAHRHVAAADVALFPAVPAGARWALLDALAWGTPVVAADSPGARSLLDAGAARLVSPEDPAALARTLGALLQDPAEAARLAERGRARVAARASRRVFGIDLECLVLAHLVARIPRGSGRRPAVLLDRDGTVVRDVPYNADPAAVVLEPDAGRAIGWMRDAGFEVVVVSNQSAVARGLCSEADVRAVNERVQSLLQAEGAGVDAFYFCPHHPERGDACDCRKPEPGLLLRAARERGLDLGKSFLVGDSERDLEAGRRAGVRSLAYGGTGWLALARDILGLAWQARGA